MALFDDFLITCDYDNTLTGPDGTVAERNLEAIRYFTENGGAFTVNTGRSGVTSRRLMEQIPANVPFLLMNGSAVVEKGNCLELHPIELEPWAVLTRLAETFPGVELEIQGLWCHYLWNPSPRRLKNHEDMDWNYRVVKPGDDLGIFVKFNVFLPNLTLRESLLTADHHIAPSRQRSGITVGIADGNGGDHRFTVGDKGGTVTDGGTRRHSFNVGHLGV